MLVAERRGWMSRNEWEDICSRWLGIVNVNEDLEVHFAGADGSITSDDTNLDHGTTLRTTNETVNCDAVLVSLLCCVCFDTCGAYGVPTDDVPRQRWRLWLCNGKGNGT
jgi:hypothetical protein